MMRLSCLILSLMVSGAIRIPIEKSLQGEYRIQRLHPVHFDLALRGQIGQLGFITGLSGFRSLLADFLFVQAHVAWEQTEWNRMLLLFRQVTALQPRVILFWERAAWHMAWNASNAAASDPTQSRLALRIRSQRHYIGLGKDFLERGILHNPERPELYEALGRLYRDKYHNHERAAECFDKAADLPGAPGYMRRFAAYELARCEGRQQEAYDRLRTLYAAGKTERAPTLIHLLRKLENKLDIPIDERISDSQ